MDIFSGATPLLLKSGSRTTKPVVEASRPTPPVSKKAIPPPEAVDYPTKQQFASEEVMSSLRDTNSFFSDTGRNGLLAAATGWVMKSLRDFPRPTFAEVPSCPDYPILSSPSPVLYRTQNPINPTDPHTLYIEGIFEILNNAHSPLKTDHSKSFLRFSQVFESIADVSV
jgi:hypothetical protein